MNRSPIASAGTTARLATVSIASCSVCIVFKARQKTRVGRAVPRAPRSFCRLPILLANQTRNGTTQYNVRMRSSLVPSLSGTEREMQRMHKFNFAFRREEPGNEAPCAVPGWHIQRTLTMQLNFHLYIPAHIHSHSWNETLAMNLGNFWL